MGFCVAVLLICFFLWFVGYNYAVEKYIPQMTVVAVIITAVGTTANAYRERKLKRQEKIKEIITEKRSVWLEKTREAIAGLYAAERMYIDSLSKGKDGKKKFDNIEKNMSLVIFSLPYNDKELVDDIRCLVDNIKSVDPGDEERIKNVLYCICKQEDKCRRILKEVWEDIKSEAKAEKDE